MPHAAQRVALGGLCLGGDTRGIDDFCRALRPRPNPQLDDEGCAARPKSPYVRRTVRRVDSQPYAAGVAGWCAIREGNAGLLL